MGGKARKHQKTMVMEQLRDCIDGLLHFTLNSYIDSTLDFDLGISNTFCSNLLLHDPQDPPSPFPSATIDCLQGVPRYPLYKRLASALYESIRRGSFYTCDNDNNMFVKDEVSSRQIESKWSSVIREKGSQLLDMMKTPFIDFHVQPPNCCSSKDAGFETIEGSWDVDSNRIERGAMVLLNKTVVLEVEDVRRYASISKMLESFSSLEFLPGIAGTNSGDSFMLRGIRIYKKLCTKEKETSNSVLAVYLSKPDAQLCLPLATILFVLSYAGIQSLLGLGHTSGTVENALPPARSVLLSSFRLLYKPKGGTLTHGARALAKHANRSSSSYWGMLTGNDSSKNEHAMDVICRLLASCCWMNIHFVPPHGVVFEIRGVDGCGARWSRDGTKVYYFYSWQKEKKSTYMYMWVKN